MSEFTANPIFLEIRAIRVAAVVFGERALVLKREEIRQARLRECAAASAAAAVEEACVARRQRRYRSIRNAAPGLL